MVERIDSLSGNSTSQTAGIKDSIYVEAADLGVVLVTNGRGGIQTVPRLGH